MSDADPAANGKKVFFVHPNSVIQKDLVAELIRQEYEVLLVPGPEEALRVFRKFPDSLAFLNIDEGLSEEDWEAFVDQVQSDPETSQIRLGILTYNTDPELAQKYLLDHGLPCGFIKLTLGLQDSTAIVLKALEANEARGRRRYLRVHCRDNSKLNLRTDAGTVEGKILDLSSVGMACTFPGGAELPVHAVLESIQLKLKGALCLVNGVVMGSRPLEDGTGRAYVVLFDPKTPPVQRDKIRTYLQWALQTSIEEMFA